MEGQDSDDQSEFTSRETAPKNTSCNEGQDHLLGEHPDIDNNITNMGPEGEPLLENMNNEMMTLINSIMAESGLTTNHSINIDDLHAMATANLISQTQEAIIKEYNLDMDSPDLLGTSFANLDPLLPTDFDSYIDSPENVANLDGASHDKSNNLGDVIQQTDIDFRDDSKYTGLGEKEHKHTDIIKTQGDVVMLHNQGANQPVGLKVTNSEQTIPQKEQKCIEVTKTPADVTVCHNHHQNVNQTVAFKVINSEQEHKYIEVTKTPRDMVVFHNQGANQPVGLKVINSGQEHKYIKPKEVTKTPRDIVVLHNQGTNQTVGLKVINSGQEHRYIEPKEVTKTPRDMVMLHNQGANQTVINSGQLTVIKEPVLAGNSCRTENYTVINTETPKTCDISDKVEGKLLGDQTVVQTVSCDIESKGKSPTRRRKGPVQRRIVKIKDNNSPELVSGDGIVICEVCGERFPNKKGLHNHMPTHNPTCCSIPGCGRSFSYPSHYKYHLLTHRDMYPGNFCQYCGKFYKSKPGLYVHEKSHMGQSPYMCCGEPFFSKTQLEEHRCNKHGKEKTFVCDICGHKAATKRTLKAHSSIHQKEFKCEWCSTSFPKQKFLDDHKRAKHNGEKNYICQCGKRFGYQANLSRHRKVCKFKVEGK